MFILEGAYDSWQLHNILGFPCATYGQNLEHCSKAQNASLENYGVAMRASIRTALDSTGHHKQSSGAFVSQCIIHVQSAFNENHDVWHGMLRVNGKTPHDIVSEWYFGQGKGPALKTADILAAINSARRTLYKKYKNVSLVQRFVGLCGL